MLRSAEHRRMAFRTVLCSDGSCVSPTWDKSSEGGSMMNEPAVEPGRTMEALRAQARGGPEKLIYERVLPPSPPPPPLCRPRVGWGGSFWVRYFFFSFFFSVSGSCSTSPLFLFFVFL